MKVLKLILKLMLFLPIAACAMYFSYRIDPSGLFWGAGFERFASEAMLSGEYIDGYERLDGRALNEVYAKNVPYAPDVLVTGSSRVMLITSKFAGSRTFYNAGNVGADMYDMYTSYYIFEKEGKTPKTFVIGLDPWIFSGYTDRRSDQALCCEFFGEVLGIDMGDYEEVNEYEKYEALIDPSYFQASVRYYLRDKTTDVCPEIVDKDDIYDWEEVIKCPDGSIIYDKAFRTRDQRYADEEAWRLAQNHFYLLDGIQKVDSQKAEYFETFIEYVQSQGVEVIFYLPPYHPSTYEIDSAYAEEAGVKNSYEVVEKYIRKVAKKYGITVYGSYDAESLGLTNEDFLDGLHVRQESLSKILPVFE